MFFWFAGAIANYAGVSLPTGVAVLLLCAPLMQPQFLLWPAARLLARRAGGGRVAVAIVGAGVYLGSEWLLPKLFADTLGHGQFPAPRLRQAADLAGAPGLTFVLLLANESLLALLRGPTRAGRGRAAVAFAGLAGALLLYGEVRLGRFATSRATEAPLVAGMVQADISRYARLAQEMGTYDATRMILDRHFALSRQLLDGERLDLLVWPETVYPTTFGAPKSEAGAELDREIAGFVAHHRVPLLFGAYDAEGAEEYNAAILLQPEGGGELSFAAHRKAILFPLTERVPAWLDHASVRARLPWLGTWKGGGVAGVLELRRADGDVVRLAPLICYDAVEPRLAIDAVRRGAEVIVTLSNDSWFAEGGGPRLHLVVSAFRSLETRRPQIRATNTGISAVIDSTGELLGTIRVGEKGVLVARVAPEREARTLVLAWGDWFRPAVLALALASLTTSFARSSRVAS